MEIKTVWLQWQKHTAANRTQSCDLVVFVTSEGGTLTTGWFCALCLAPCTLAMWPRSCRAQGPPSPATLCVCVFVFVCLSVIASKHSESVWMQHLSVSSRTPDGCPAGPNQREQTGTRANLDLIHENQKTEPAKVLQLQYLWFQWRAILLEVCLRPDLLSLWVLTADPTTQTKLDNQLHMFAVCM